MQVSVVPRGSWLRPSDQLILNAQFSCPPICSEEGEEEETFENFALAVLCAKEGGCIVVDSFSSTDFQGVGNSFPPSLAINVPVWCCILNRLVLRVRKMMRIEKEASWDVSLKAHFQVIHARWWW
eukprot:655411-Hanusia_phi.AAC.1